MLLLESEVETKLAPLQCRQTLDSSRLGMNKTIFSCPEQLLEVQLSVRPSVRRSVGPSLDFVKKLPLQYQMVTKTYLKPTYLCDSSDGSDSSDQQ